MENDVISHLNVNVDKKMSSFFQSFYSYVWCFYGFAIKIPHLFLPEKKIWKLNLVVLYCLYFPIYDHFNHSLAICATLNRCKQTTTTQENIEIRILRVCPNKTFLHKKKQKTLTQSTYGTLLINVTSPRFSGENN